MSEMFLLQLAFIMILAFVHVTAGWLLYLSFIPRSAWLSFSGGVSIAYVFLHIFPELEQAQQSLEEFNIIYFLEHHAYFVALIGLSFFYGLERFLLKRNHPAPTGDKAKPGKGSGKWIFWLHIGSFSLYNALIGYLMVYRDSSISEEFFYFLAMAFHFLVNDHSLYHHHNRRYLHYGRWVLSAAIILGWLIGLYVELSEAATGMLFAFVAGGIILNVLKEELPEERNSRILPFMFGGVSYSALLFLG